MAGIAHLLLIDDDAELAALMRDFFGGQEIDLTSAQNGVEGLAMALRGGFDLILLDVMMPGLDGFEVLKRLRAERGTPVLMLTARAESESRIRGLNEGADDYLPKPFEPTELLARVNAILRRTRGPARDPLLPVEIGGIRLDPSTRAVTKNGNAVEVTTIEFDILEMLMRAAGHVVSRDELAQRLYNRPASPYDRSIDVHISHLRKKLDGATDLIRTIRGAGYQLALETAPSEAT
ncbi:MAG: response regulator transcription factor [Bryobacteraceae bacterium]